MNTMQKIAQVHGAAKHVLRQRMTKSAFDKEKLNELRTLAAAGRLSPEAIKALEQLQQEKFLDYVLRGAGKGALKGSGFFGASGALAGGLATALSGGNPVVGLLAGTGGGAAIGAGLGSVGGGIGSAFRYPFEKAQLKAILKSVNSDLVQPSDLKAYLGKYNPHDN